MASSKLSQTLNSRIPRRDVMVSVRLPKSLVEELKDIQQINHFLDLSDEIRFVVRRYCFSFLNTNTDTAVIPADMLAEQKRKEQLITELTRIVDTLKGKTQDTLTAAKKNE